MATRRQFLQKAGYGLILLNGEWRLVNDARTKSSGITPVGHQAPNRVQAQRGGHRAATEQGPSEPAAAPETPPRLASRPPAPADLRYRNQQPYLFQTVRDYSAPARVAGGPLLYFEQGSTHHVTPSYTFVDKVAGWAWDRPGGDYLDANLARNPASPIPWFSVLANAASGITAEADYTADVTSALKFIETADRWNALFLSGNTARWIASTFSANPPRIEVTYKDGAAETLTCRIVARSTSSSSYPSSTAAALPLPAFLEFERPAKEVASAKLHFRITQHAAGSNPVIKGYVLDPPMNSDPVTTGIAYAAPLDAGLPGHRSIIGTQQYLDGTVLDNFVYPAHQNFYSEAWFDPALWDRGPKDATKLPHIGLGKWIGGRDTTPGRESKLSIVNSRYSADNFKPLAPGIGAFRVLMMGNPALKDGSYVGVGIGYSTTNLRIFMPAHLWSQDHLFTRYYIRIAAPNGHPYRMPVEKKYQVYESVGGPYVWTDCAGKIGIMPDHVTTYGGVSGSAGGGRGWQMRNRWNDIWHDDVGPDLGGLGFGLHTYDFQSNNPQGYNFGATDDKTRSDSGFGQRGGLGGILYADIWYCVESELKLNSVMPGAPGYVPDGEIRYWIDGRLVLERTGMVFRTLPMYDPGYQPTRIRPTRDLGIRSLWFNWYHGGLTQNSVDRLLFISQLAYGTSYIGPMRFPG
jgi:hypothetical protein